MRPTPFPHQHTGAAFLAERRFGLLADSMGIGKTACAIIAADTVQARRILVICPAVVRTNWEDEILTWQKMPRTVTTVEGRPRQPPGDGVTIVSHASLADKGSVAVLQKGGPYDAIIIDESHELRQFDAARTRNMFAPGGLLEQANRLWCLTGTPVVNSAADLWPLAFGPMRMQVSWWDWCMRFATLKPVGNGDVRPIGIREPGGLADLFRPVLLRRTPESVGVRLPPLAVHDVPLPADPTVLARAMAGLEHWNPQRLALALDEQDELRDSAMASVRRALGMAKATAVAEHVHAILAAGDGPVVAFFQHTDVRRAMHAALVAHGHTVSWIDGTVTRPQLRAAKDWFQAGKLDVLLVQTQAGGVGLTLTRAHRAVVGELPWTAVALHQAIKRIHRIGQTAACTADVIRLQGCWLEDALASTVGRKHRASEDFLGRLTTNR